MNTEVLNTVIVGRVEPHIYAFETCSVPNFLKIGDTYRPVYQRLEEWKRRYKNLQKRYDAPAVVEDKYFRDYSVHSYVENVLGRQRIKETDFAKGLYPSNEFFRGALPEDIDKAIDDIKHSYATNNGLYSFYSINDVPAREEIQYVRNTEFTKLRDNQQQVVENFKAALSKGRKKLLMYAVMRFGKSITAMSCAEAMENCQIVVIVSAKADVKSGWEETIKTIKNFEDFKFANGEKFKENPNYISEVRSDGKKLAICLTLQDISTSEIKERYHELFNQTQIDLLIVDETHFGARAEHYGRVLQQNPLLKKEADEDDKEETLENLQQIVHTLNSRVQLHLSGTPYRILMGNEFAEDDIICQCTYPDIIEAGRVWDERYLDIKDEWENPYFGFPQMVRFAFNFNKSSLKKLEQLKANGKDFAFEALFETYKDQEGSIRFVNESEVLDLLKAINSGDEDENVLSFLNNERIKNGQLCHHIVMVLPRRAACDAMQRLISIHPEIKPLSDYVTINAAGTVNRIKKLSQIKSIISSSERNNKRTLTLTVNRMLTGTTVPEWDTMIFLKGTSSPQEYDQATYRLQNPYVIDYKDESGRTVRRNMKPQTLLVDFSPERVFFLQEQRAFYNSTNSHHLGNGWIEEEITREISISPILFVNKDKLQEVSAVDIIDKLRKYSSERSILDEAREIGPDYSLREDSVLFDVINRYAAIDSKNIMKTKAHEGEETDADIPDSESSTEAKGKQTNKSEADKKEPDNFEKKLATFYSHILFFAYLTHDRVKTIVDILNVCDSEDNKRIANHLGLDMSILERLSTKMHPSRREMLEYKIANVNDLSHDYTLDPTEKVEQAMKQFGRWSESEIVTPANIANDMIALIPEDRISKGTRFLDIASKEGEFANAIIKRFGERFKTSIYSLPTSGIAYEFTRKVYEELEMPIENIFTDFNSYSLIDSDKEKYTQIIKDMKFNIIVGNPPYHDPHSKDEDAVNRAFSSAVYPYFMDIASEACTDYMALITPSRWMTKTGQGVSDKWVDKMIDSDHFVIMHDFYNALDCFNKVEIKGGVCYFLYSPKYHGPCNYIMHQNKSISIINDKLNPLGAGVVIRDPKAFEILKRVKAIEGQYYLGQSFEQLVGPVHLFDKDGILGTKWNKYSLEKTSDCQVKYYLNKKVEECGTAWIRREDIPKGIESIDIHKVYISEAYNGGDGFPHRIIGKPFYGEPNSVCSETYLCICYNQKNKSYSELECKNIMTYMETRFFRFLVSLKKKTQHAPSAVYQFVPLQDFTRPWTDADLYAKYNLTNDEIAYIESMIKPMD